MSSLSWETFFNTDYACLEDAAEVWNHYISAAAETETKLIEDIPVLKPGAADQERDDFDGETAEQVRAQARRICDLYLDDVDTYAGRIKVLLLEAKDEFESKRGDLADLFSEKSVYLTAKGGPGEEHFEVNESDLYNYLTGSGSFQPMNEYEANDYEQRVREQAVDMSDRFKELMDSVRELDDKYATDFKALNDDPPPLPPYVGGADFTDKVVQFLQERHQEMFDRIESGDATPEEVAQWWATIAESDQDVIAAELPEQIAMVDGVDTDDRDTANRVLLDEELASTTDRIAELEYLTAVALAEGDPNGNYAAMMSELEALREQEVGLSRLHDRIEEPYVLPNGESLEYYLLGYDSADDGKAIVAVGNPDTADNVNVYVPGTGADLAGIGGDGNQPGQGDIGRAEKTVLDAYTYAPGESTAAVMWLGYDAPDEVPPYYEDYSGGFESGAADTKYANDATESLDSFIDGIRASDSGGEANLSAAGHSYGSTVIGTADRDAGLDVDNVIFVGSPGVGTLTASGLQIDPSNVWATQNSEDAIQYATVHGTNPTSDAFGANVFASDAPRDGAVENHKAYWDDDNVARENMAYIITGQDIGGS